MLHSQDQDNIMHLDALVDSDIVVARKAGDMNYIFIEGSSQKMNHF